MAKKKQSGELQKMAVAADGVILTYIDKEIKLLLIKRGNAPFKGEWALPGGFVGTNETAEDCIAREVMEETGLTKLNFEQVCSMSDPKRDPRTRVISVVFYACVKSAKAELVAGDDASDAKWHSLSKLPKLAFDHSKIVKATMQRIKDCINYQGAAFDLLPDKFTFSQLQGIYEDAMDLEMDKRNFRRRFLNSGILIPLNEVEKNVPYKPGQYFKFDRKSAKSNPELMPVF